MTFAATVAQLLLSSPSDLPADHREVVIRAIRTWNNSHGRRMAVLFSPTNWEEGSSPEYGLGPQESLNRQVVDSSDLGLVILTDRLGTPTQTHLSGTVEEIERLHEQGKRVAILRNMAAREPSCDTQQAADLMAYLDSIQDKALYREYRSLDELLSIVNSVLNDVSFGIQPPTVPDASRGEKNQLALGVWPRGEGETYQETDTKGRLKTNTKHRLVLQNDTGVPVTNVSFRLENSDGDEATVLVIGNDEPLSLMAPGAQHRFPLALHMGSPNSVLCIVSWTDPEEQTHETSATVTLM